MRLCLASTIITLLAALPCRAQQTLDDELHTLVRRALRASPVVGAQRRRVSQALDRHEELLGFFDPGLYAAAGKAERGRGVPGSSGFTSLTNDAHDVQAGVETPVVPGAYVSLGAAERFLFDDADYSHLYQTLLGMRVRVPLARDKGFRQWDLSRAVALAEYNAAVAALISTLQGVQHDVERAYVQAYEALAAYQVAQGATRRFRTLLEYARELADLDVVPSYQIYPAEMELAFREEDEQSTKQAYELSLIALARVIGDVQPVELRYEADHLVTMAMALQDLQGVDLMTALDRRGDFLQVQHVLDAARGNLERAQDDLKPDVYLNAGVTWQGEDPGAPWGTRSIRSDKGLGGEVTVVYRRPLMYRAERSRLQRMRGRIAEVKQNLEKVRIDIHADMQSARQSFQRVQERLQLLDRALEAARQTVDAESERFRLGEGRSRDVLDAQRDLNTAQQRQTRAAAALLRALYDYQYAAGYP